MVFIVTTDVFSGFIQERNKCGRM